MRLDRQSDAFVSEPHVHLPHALQLGELREHQPEGILHALVWVLLDPLAPGLHVTGGDTEKQRAPAGFLLQGLL